MLFADLLELPFDRATGVISVEAIVSALPGTPYPVARQLFADHGRKDEFQRQYGPLCLDDLRWTHERWQAGALLQASMNPEYQRWFENVRGRTARFDSDGWSCIDVRREVQEHWDKMRTWRLPPVFLSGATFGLAARLHLVEGHTRLGTLAGLVDIGILAKTSTHEIWLGSKPRP